METEGTADRGNGVVRPSVLIEKPQLIPTHSLFFALLKQADEEKPAVISPHSLIGKPTRDIFTK